MIISVLNRTDFNDSDRIKIILIRWKKPVYFDTQKYKVDKNVSGCVRWSYYA